MVSQSKTAGIVLDCCILQPSLLRSNTVLKERILERSVLLYNVITSSARQILYKWFVCGIRSETYCGTPAVLVSEKVHLNQHLNLRDSGI